MKIAKRCPCCGSSDLLRAPAVLMPFVASRVFGWEPVAITQALGLRDLRLGHAYSPCTSLGCPACGHLFLDMRFDDEEMAALYADYRGPEYCALRDRFEPGYAARNALLNAGSPYIQAVEGILAPHLPPRPRVLDWGGDTGLNTPFLGKAARLDVYEISGKPPVPGARRVGADGIRAGAYDLIVCAQVLEHVPDPLALVRAMASAADADTLVYVELPHEALMRESPDIGACVARKHHWHEHVNFFSAGSIAAILDAADLAGIETISHPVLAGGRTAHVFSVLARRKSGAPASNSLG